MRLILSSRHPRNSAYSTESGQVLYKVTKPQQLGSGVATIRKVVKTVNGVWAGDLELKPEVKPLHLDMEAQEKEELIKDDHCSMSSQGVVFSNHDSEDDEWELSTNELPAAEGHFAFYAQVEFHAFTSARFRYNNLDIPVREFFRKEGWSWYGRGRVFTASDGQEYRWDLRVGHLEMFKNDGSKQPLVKFFEHHFPLGPLVKGRPATLEVDDSCIAILDEIIMTFVYCQKLRKDRERSQKNAAH